ncbi:hypothetical protein SAMN05444339_103163 [Loktanella atrilutea]|uniref:Uncharacterized protein n=1 Tax=Loktanella atrilutea TaxID=366533 RepID=A0A1M4YLF8_LOKAT|nr:hypothetical protein [Loktanella atrilutea]SHF06382.1 hypothetical protein SAMN05444339_103163 [Loktanella atrilutea]
MIRRQIACEDALTIHIAPDPGKGEVQAPSGIDKASQICSTVITVIDIPDMALIAARGIGLTAERD